MVQQLLLEMCTKRLYTKVDATVSNIRTLLEAYFKCSHQMAIMSTPELSERLSNAFLSTI